MAQRCQWLTAVYFYSQTSLFAVARKKENIFHSTVSPRMTAVLTVLTHTNSRSHSSSVAYSYTKLQNYTVQSLYPLSATKCGRDIKFYLFGMKLTLVNVAIETVFLLFFYCRCMMHDSIAKLYYVGWQVLKQYICYKSMWWPPTYPHITYDIR